MLSHNAREECDGLQRGFVQVVQRQHLHRVEPRVTATSRKRGKHCHTQPKVDVITFGLGPVPDAWQNEQRDGAGIKLK